MTEKTNNNTYTNKMTYSYKENSLNGLSKFNPKNQQSTTQSSQNNNNNTNKK